MRRIYFTIDTEYEAGFARCQGLDRREENFDRAVRGRTSDGDVGIFYQMDVFERFGHRGVFFVDPMPALHWGTAAIADIVEPILKRGHDVQLHLHTEWLGIGDSNPITGTRKGNNLSDFSFEDQCALIDWARNELMKAGAPCPVAFRAGNYAANNDTLRALAQLGFGYDSSHTPGFADSLCRIELDQRHQQPTRILGVTEVPVGCIGDALAELRHAQLTALSLRELVAATKHAVAADLDSFTIVSHSFELLCRNRERINTLVKRRFDRYCEILANMRDASTATYAENPPQVAVRTSVPSALPASYLRTGERMLEQAVGNMVYGRNWKRNTSLTALAIACLAFEAQAA